MLIFLLNLCIAYLLGSLSSAIIVCRLAKLPDPRAQGSGNPGTTNVLRLGGKKWAVLVLIGDMLKGVLAILMAKYCLPFALWPWIGIAVIVGHFYPLFFKFQGGKGVATAAGVLLTLFWPLGLATLGVWIMVFLITRYSSLAAIIATLSVPLFAWYWHLPLTPLILMAGLILWRHRINMQRLLTGTESRFTRSK